MTAVAELVGTWEPLSPEWHAARATGLGASEIAAVVGLSPWESKFSLWHRKAGLIGSPDETAEMTWGRYFEEPIARRYADEHPGLEIKATGTWRSMERPWQLANPDRLIVGLHPFHEIPLEVKWSPFGDGWGETDSDAIPVYYRCQVLQQCDVLGVPFGVLIAVVGADFREYLIDADSEQARADLAVLRGEGAEFMASLPRGDNPGQRPDLDCSEHTYRVMRDLHPDIDDEEAEISPELADDFRAARAGLRDAEDRNRYVSALVLDEMDRARRAVCDGERVAIRVPSRYGIQLRETKPKKTGDEATQTIREAIAS